MKVCWWALKRVFGNNLIVTEFISAPINMLIYNRVLGVGSRGYLMS